MYTEWEWMYECKYNMMYRSRNCFCLCFDSRPTIFWDTFLIYSAASLLCSNSNDFILTLTLAQFMFLCLMYTILPHPWCRCRWLISSTLSPVLPRFDVIKLLSCYHCVKSMSFVLCCQFFCFLEITSRPLIVFYCSNMMTCSEKYCIYAFLSICIGNHLPQQQTTDRNYISRLSGWFLLVASTLIWLVLTVESFL